MLTVVHNKPQMSGAHKERKNHDFRAVCDFVSDVKLLFNRSAHSAVPSTRDDSHGKWEQGTGKKDCMGSENREPGRRVAWEVGTGRWEEGLH